MTVLCLCVHPAPLYGGCHPAPAVGTGVSSCHGFATHFVVPLQLVAAQLVTPLCIKSCPPVKEFLSNWVTGSRDHLNDRRHTDKAVEPIAQSPSSQLPR